MKTLIKDTTIVPMTSEDEILHGDIAIDGKSIVAIGQVPRSFVPDRTIDAHGKIAMPTLVNAHTHLSMTYFRNYRDSVSDLHDWLSEIWKLEDALVAEDTYPASLLGIAEMISSGTTCFADMYFFPEGTTEAILETKMKANIGITLFGDLQDSQQRAAERLPILREQSARSEGKIRYDIAPHAVYTCTGETLRYAVRLAEDEGCKIHIHANETRQEVEDSLSSFGKTPIAYLDSLGFSSVDCYYAHCVHPSGEDIAILRKNQTSVVHNPSSNCKLGSGIAPLATYLEHEIPVALGTDGASSNNTLDMFQEIRLAAMLAAVSTGDAARVSPFQILRMATLGGAKALGRENECGTLEVGKDADLMLLSTDSPHMSPINNIFSALVFSARSSDVQTVFCAGEILMQDRRLLVLDEQSVRDRFNAHWEQIQRRSSQSETTEEH